MKKIYSLLIAATSIASAQAQHHSAVHCADECCYTPDRLLLPWVFDVNLKGGGLSQSLETANTKANYLNGVNLNTGGDLKFDNGKSFGFDAQLGFFFGHSRHFGVGAGFMYLRQQGDLSMSDKYHVEYQATDVRGDVYRQMITSNQTIKEELTITNMNIPVMLKYKTRFSKVLGFTMDAGALLNVKALNSYKSNATFDYEAVYKFATDANGVPTDRMVYDASQSPSATSVLYTRAQYADVQDVNSYFNNNLRAAGYNVGLNVAPKSNTGDVSYKTVSVGFMVQPALNFFLSDNVALNLGGYYMYQPMKNDNKTDYRVTNNVGDYSSVMNSVTSVKNHGYGVNVGVRFFFGKHADHDHDGIADKFDRCPHDSGLAAFNGCPDSDGDGVPDYLDSCMTVAGLAKYHGCPDSDGDGILDADDACPGIPGLAQFQGCPDRDGDGIPDKNDACPDKAGSAAFNGCPDTDGDGIADDKDKCPELAGPADNNGCPVAPKLEEKTKVSTPILFKTNRTEIQKESYPTLAQAVVKLSEDKDAYIVIDGYTDVTGKPAYNKALSLKRANAVKAQLKKMGVDPKRVKVVAHGPDDPIGDNNTEDGRLKNRRAVMKLSVGE